MSFQESKQTARTFSYALLACGKNKTPNRRAKNRKKYQTNARKDKVSKRE